MDFEINEALTARGFRGDRAVFSRLELVAIERPGWIQVYEFEVRVSDRAGEDFYFFGVVRDDERKNFEMHLAETKDEQEAVSAKWSAGLLTREVKPLRPVHMVLLGVFAIIMATAVIGAIVTWASGGA